MADNICRKSFNRAVDNLNPCKIGRKKTVAMIKGYCMTMIVFAFFVVIVLFSFSMPADPTSPINPAMFRAPALMFLTLAEAVFGVYTSLSLRLRKLEEPAEEKNLRGRK